MKKQAWKLLNAIQITCLVLLVVMGAIDVAPALIGRDAPNATRGSVSLVYVLVIMLWERVRKLERARQ